MIKKGEPSDIQYYRKDMPQIKAEFFNDFLEWSGITCNLMYVDGNVLKPTQIDINEDKVNYMTNRVLTNDPTFKGVITISADAYVLDGHHRWLAFINAGVSDIQCRVLSLTAKEALIKMHSYPKVIRQDINDTKLI